MNDKHGLADAINYLNAEPGWADPDMPDDESWQDLPDDPTGAQLRESLQNTRADTCEALKTTARCIEDLQRQVDALSRKANDHRHALGQGQGWSGKPEF